MDITLRDQLGRSVVLHSPPNRIVSLVPSITETLFDLGVGDQVVGRTKFCIHPSEAKQVVKIGGTKSVHIDVIRNLHPDIVIANKEENRFEDVDSIQSFCPVYVSDVSNLTQAIQMVRDLGAITGMSSAANVMCEQINESLEDLDRYTSLRSLYLIWANPYMAAGKHTYIDFMMQKAGFVNLVTQDRYPNVDLENINPDQIDALLLSSEPFPFSEKHLEGLPKGLREKTIFVDGEMFSWYGSRLIKAGTYLNELRSKMRP